MSILSASQNFHAGAQAALDAVPTPVDAAGVSAAQLAVAAVWEGRGSYGCERHLYEAAMRRVSAPLWAEGADSAYYGQWPK